MLFKRILPYSYIQVTVLLWYPIVVLSFFQKQPLGNYFLKLIRKYHYPNISYSLNLMSSSVSVFCLRLVLTGGTSDGVSAHWWSACSRSGCILSVWMLRNGTSSSSWMWAGGCPVAIRSLHSVPSKSTSNGFPPHR